MRTGLSLRSSRFSKSERTGDIRSDGSLTGDVVAARISIEDGAFFKGGIDIRKGGTPAQQKPNGEDKSVIAAEPAVVGARA